MMWKHLVGYTTEVFTRANHKYVYHYRHGKLELIQHDPRGCCHVPLCKKHKFKLIAVEEIRADYYSFACIRCGDLIGTKRSELRRELGFKEV